MTISGTIGRALLVLATVIAIALAGSVSVSATGGHQKVLVCHAAGRDGTTHYVTLSVPPNAGGYPQGHFTENGTQAAGHEADYLGACEEVTPSPTPTPTPTATPTPTPTPSAVPSSSPTPEPTATPTPTSTPTPTVSPTPTATATPTVTSTPTQPVPTPPATDTESSASAPAPGSPILLILAAIFAAATAYFLRKPVRR